MNSPKLKQIAASCASIYPSYIYPNLVNHILYSSPSSLISQQRAPILLVIKHYSSFFLVLVSGSYKMSQAQANDAEKNIEIWKVYLVYSIWLTSPNWQASFNQVKKLIKRLTEARGNGTSMISLIIPPKDQVSRAAKMLSEEYVSSLRSGL